MLVNCIYWEARYPRLVTAEAARRLYGGRRPPRLRVIGDISCDIEGAIEPTVKVTSPDRPAFVWDPESGAAVDGVAGRGPAIMAVDHLQCAVRAAGGFLGRLWRGPALLPALAACDFSVDFDACSLPAELRRATILHHGRLTPAYRYLADSVRA